MELQPYLKLFSFINETGLNKPITNIVSLGVEERTGEYYYDNNFRNLDAYLFQYTLKGTGILEIDGVPHEVPENHGFFIKIPGNTRYYFPQGWEEPWTFLFILLEAGKMEEYFERTVEKIGSIFYLDAADPLIEFLKNIYVRTKAGMISDFIEASTTAFEFMNRLYFRFHNSSIRYSNRIQRVLQVIQSDYASIDSISQIGDELGISENHLIREFKQEVGTTPLKYITQLRIEHAKKMLLTSNMSVEQISSSCGYTRANYFCRMFKKVTGMTPLEFRQGGDG